MVDGNLYTRMCQTHPIQGEWKLKNGDLVYQLHNKKHSPYVFHDVHEYDRCVGDDERTVVGRDIWLLTQEQWQEICFKNKNKTITPEALNKFWNELYIPMAVVTNMGESEWWTILWCLFVSKEVYGLEWDWEKSVWRKA